MVGQKPIFIGFKFYPDGKKKSKYFYAEGEVSGPQYTYYNNGNIKSVIFYKNDSTWWLALDHDNKGKIITTKGSTIQILSNPGFEVSKVGERLGLINVVSQYKNTRAILNIRFRKGEDILLDTTVTEFATVIHKPLFAFAHDFTMPGSYNYAAIARLFDVEDGSLIKEDSLKLVIKVR